MDLLADNMILYSDLGQKIQTWNPINGHIPIPAHANISSIILFLEANDSHVVLPYSIIYPPGYFNVTHHPIVTVRKNNNTYHGTLHSRRDDKMRSITLRMMTGNTEKAITIYDYDTIEETNSSRFASSLPNHEDTIYIIPTTSSPASSPMTITYLIDSLSWRSVYTVLLDTTTSTIAMLRLSAEITNSGVSSFTSAKTSLLAGSVRQGPALAMSRNAKSRASMAQSAMVMEVTPTEFTTPRAIDEYLEFPISSITVGAGETIPVELFTLTSISSKKIYFNSLGENRSVSFGYRFSSPRTLPAGTMIVYSTGHTGELLGPFLGSTQISESREHDDIDMILGVTSSVKIESNIESSQISVSEGREEKKKQERLTMRAKITNRNPVDIFVILRRSIYDARIVSSSNTTGWTMTRKGPLIEYSGEVGGGSLDPNEIIPNVTTFEAELILE